MTDTTGRRVRIETHLDSHGRAHTESTHVYLGDTEITDQVSAVEWKHGVGTFPVATIHFPATVTHVQADDAELDVEAEEAACADPSPFRTGGIQDPACQLPQRHPGRHRFGTSSWPSATPEQTVAAPQLLCVACLIDRHNGVRDDVLPAMVILNGASVCKEHFKIQDGPAPLPDRTQGGLIIPGANGS